MDSQNYNNGAAYNYQQQQYYGGQQPPQQQTYYSQQPAQPVQYSAPQQPYVDAPQNTGLNQNDESHSENHGLLQQNNGLDKFSDRDIRIGFIKKVYTLMTLQLTVTAIFVILACNFLNDFIYKNHQASLGIMIGAIVGYFLTAILLLCCRLGRIVPLNYILVTIFTLCLSTMVGFIAAQYEPQVVTAAAVCTAGMVIGITVFAFTTKKDFTVFGPVLFVVGFAFVFILPFFFMFNRTLHLIYAYLAVILFSFYLLYDTQLIMGGKRYTIDIDDYIMAAMILYLDIINIFLQLLKIFGNK